MLSLHRAGPQQMSGSLQGTGEVDPGYRKRRACTGQLECLLDVPGSCVDASQGEEMGRG